MLYSATLVHVVCDFLLSSVIPVHKNTNGVMNYSCLYKVDVKRGVCAVVQGRFRALKYGSYSLATSATSSFRSTYQVCSSSSCPGSRSGSTSKQVRRASPSAC